VSRHVEWYAGHDTVHAIFDQANGPPPWFGPPRNGGRGWWLCGMYLSGPTMDNIKLFLACLLVVGQVFLFLSGSH